MKETTKELFLKAAKLFVKEGRYLKPPHGRLIWEGKKTLIVTKRRFRGEDKPRWLLSGGKAWGVIRLHPPKEISLEEFQELRNKHLVSPAERRSWWPGARSFFAYEIRDFIALDEPEKVSIPLGVQTHVREVVFLQKQRDPYLVYPDEEKRWRYELTNHWRGKSVHGDDRYEHEVYLIGWTLMYLRPGVVKKPVMTLAEAKRWWRDQRAWKINVKTGVPLERRIRGGVIRRANILAAMKAPHPKDWLGFEGVVPKGTVGATKEFPGVFHILDQGRVEYGCLPKGTFVKTLLEAKPIEEIKVGDFLLGEGGKPNRVLHTFKRKAGSLIELSGEKFPSFKVTPNHPILCAKPLVARKAWGGFWEEVEIFWKPAGEIQVGDFLCIPRLKEVREKPFLLRKYHCLPYKKIRTKEGILELEEETAWSSQTRELFPSSEFAFFLGYFVGDGYADENSGVTLDFPKEIFPLLKARLKRFLLQFGKVEEKKLSEDHFRLVSYSNVLGRFLRDYFYVKSETKTKGKKRIPFSILTLSDSCLKAFLEGLWWADGLKDKKRLEYSLKIVTASPSIAFALILIGAKLGIGFSCGESEFKMRGWRKQFTISWPRHLLDFPSCPVPRKKLRHKRKAFGYNEDFIFVKVKKKKELVGDFEVYNLETSDRVFLVPLLVHNSLKPWFKEYYKSEGKLAQGRVTFRLLTRKEVTKELVLAIEKAAEGLEVEFRKEFDGWVFSLEDEELYFLPQSAWEIFKEIRKEVLPPGIPEEKPLSPFIWLLLVPKVQRPYVLGSEAMEKDWLPPRGFSALPEAWRKVVPKELRYWEMPRKKALEARAKLAEMEELFGPAGLLEVRRSSDVSDAVSSNFLDKFSRMEPGGTLVP